MVNIYNELTLNKKTLFSIMWVGLRQSVEGLKSRLRFPIKEGVLLKTAAEEP